MKHYDILIASPGSEFLGAYVRSLAETLHGCAQRNLSWKFLNGQSSLVHHARELTASGGEGKELDPHQTSPGKDLTYDTIVWIDSDISWTPEQFFALVDSRHEVTTGAYLLTDGSTTIHAWGRPGSVPAVELLRMREPIKVQSCGFGFIAMKRGVFEAMQRPWFNHEFQKVGTAPDGSDVIDCLGEDISWCVKAHRAKIEIWFDPRALVTHNKTMPLQFSMR